MSEPRGIVLKNFVEKRLINLQGEARERMQELIDNSNDDDEVTDPGVDYLIFEEAPEAPLDKLKK